MDKFTPSRVLLCSMSSSDDPPVFGEELFMGEGPALPIGGDDSGVPAALVHVALLDGTSLMGQLTGPDGGVQLLSVDLTDDGYTADIFLWYDAESDVPTVGQRFRVTFPSGLRLVFVAKTIPEVVKEVYHGEDEPAMFVFKFACVDPLTYIFNRPLPNILPFINSTTKEVLQTIIPLLDPTLDVSLVQTGNSIQALNPQDFSDFGGLLRSELANGNYRVRMGDGLMVEGRFGDAFGPGDYRVDYTDYRYTPEHFQVKPPPEILSSARVIPNGLVAGFRVSQYFEADMRVMGQFNLESKPLGLEDSEPLKLSSGTDVNDTDEFIKTGTVSTVGAHIILNGSLKMLDARPFGTSFIVVWSGIILTGGGASFTLGFTDRSGAFLLSVSSGDFAAAGIPLEIDTLQVQHRYAAYAVARPDGSIAVWGLYQNIDFTVSTETILGAITAIDTANRKITLDAVWDAGTDFVRVVRSGSEIGRAIIERNEIVGGVSVLTLDVNIPGAQVGDDVTRGLAASSTNTIKLLKTVSASGFGLPTLVGSGVALQSMIVQRIGQIDGKLLSRTDTNPDEQLPRDLQIDVDVTEFSDGQLSGSGSSGVISWHERFIHDARAEFIINYLVGVKRKFTCGTIGAGAHANLNVDSEQDPEVLQSMAEALCDLGGVAYPEVNGFIESTEVEGTPLPGDMLPVNLVDDYQIPSQSIPILSNKITYEGASIAEDGSYNEDVLKYTFVAGQKSPVDRVKDDFFRSRGLVKYPIRVPRLTGAQITAVSWDDEILVASVSGGSVYGPRGEALDLASGVRPADVVGIARPAAEPVVLRCTVPIVGRPHPDQVIFQVIYRPEAADPSAVFCRLFPGIKHAEFIWPLPLGALKQNVYRRKAGATGETDADLELVTTIVQPASSWQGMITKEDRSIYVESVGLCDKKSSRMKLTCVPARLGAPVLAFLKLTHDNVTKLITQPPPAEATAIRFVTAPTNVGFTVQDGIPIPTNPALAAEFVITDLPLKLEGDQAHHYSVPYDATEAGRDFYLTAAWLNFFDEPQDWSALINPNEEATAIPDKPPKPRLADLLKNEPNFDTIESDASVEVLVRADENYLAELEADWKTFDAANARGANVLYRHVRNRDRRIQVPSPAGAWTAPDNAQKSDDSRAEALGTGATLTAQLLVNGTPVGTSKNITVSGQADQIYTFGGPGDFWGAALNAWTTATLNTDGGIGVRLTINGLAQNFLFTDFDLNEPVGGQVHGVQFRLEASVLPDRFALDRITARAYFSRPEANVQHQRFGGGDFDDDALAFAKQATLAGTLKFGGVYWLWKYMLKNGRLVNTSDASDINTVFQAGLMQGALTPTIVSVERVDEGDEQHWRATVQFPQVGPTPIAPDFIRLKRRKGTTSRYKRIGDQLSLFGNDEYLAAGTVEVFVDFQALDGVTDYTLIAILTTTTGEERQSAPFAFSTNEKITKAADPGPPSQPTINYTKWKKGHGSIVRWTRPTTNAGSLHDYGIAAYFPAGAAPNARTYINLDTGATLAVPTFGRLGNAEIFVGAAERFHGHALKKDLPAGAISGGVGFILRAYNYTLVGGVATETPSVTDANFPQLSEMGQISAAEIAEDPLEEDNAPASMVQNGSLTWGAKKGFKTVWKRPQSNFKSIRYYKVVYFSGSSFMNPHTGQVSAPNTEAEATLFVPDTHHTTHLKHSELASAFLSGVQVKVTPVNVVLGVETDGTPWTSGLVPPVNDDSGATDTVAPTGLSTPVLVVPATGGLLAKQMFAASNNLTHRFTEVVFEITDSLGNPGGFLDPDTGSHTGPEIRTNIGPSGHKNIYPNRAAIAIALGSFFATWRVRAYFYVANSVGTSLKSPNSNSIALIDLKDVTLKEDSGDPGQVQTLAFSWSNRKGYKGTWKKPATNFKSVSEYTVAYQSSNGQWMNPHTGQAAADEAAATIRVGDTHHTTHLRFSELAAAFRPPFTVTIKVSAVNTVNGAERVGPALTATTSAASDDPLGEDTGFPNNGNPITVQRTKHKKGGILIVDFVMPTVNMNTYEKTVLVIHDNNETGVGRRFFDPYTNTWVASYPDGTQELSFAQGGVPALPIRRNELFAGNRTRVYVRVGIKNRFNGGSTTYSTDLAANTFVDSSFVAGNPSEPDSVTEDTAIASAPTSVLLDWNTRKGFKLTFVKPTTNVNAQPIRHLIGYKVAYSDASGSVWMNPVTGSTSGVTEAAATVFIRDTDHTTGLKRGQIALSTIRAKVTPVTMINGVETDGTAAFSNTLTVNSVVEVLSNNDRIITGLEDSAAVPARILFGTHKNLIVGGSFLHDASQFPGGGTADFIGKNWRVSAVGTASRIGRLTATNGLLWDRAGHRLQCANTTASQGGQPSCRLRRQIVPGEVYAFTMMFLGASVFFVPSISVDLVDDGSGAVFATQTLSTGFSATTVWQILVAILTVSSGYAQNGQQWCRVRFGADFSNTLFLDNWCLVRNQAAVPWSPSAEEEGLDSTVAITTNTGVGAVGALAGGGNVSFTGTGFSAGSNPIGVLQV